MRRRVVLHCSVDEPAPFAGLGRTLDREFGLILQDDIDALCHELVIGSVTFTRNTRRDPYICQTHDVCTFLARFRVEGDQRNLFPIMIVALTTSRVWGNLMAPRRPIHRVPVRSHQSLGETWSLRGFIEKSA